MLYSIDKTTLHKAPIIRYSRTVTFGRMALPHQGHVRLIQLMLGYGEQADVYLSYHPKNGDWDLRVLLLKALCRDVDIDLSRVNFLKAINVFDAVAQSIEDANHKEIAFVVGSDQQQMAQKISEEMDCPFILNRRTTSSTEMRFFLDQEDFIEDARGLYNNNEFATTLAMVLRKEEKQRECT